MTLISSARPGLVREFIDIITNVAVPHQEPRATVHRRRIVVAVVLVLGIVLLSYLFTRERDDESFCLLAVAAAALWSVGALVSGPLHLGGVRFRGRNERPVFTGTGVGLVLGAVFLLGGVVVSKIPPLTAQISAMLTHVDEVSWRLVVLVVILNAIAEEMFFRGALYTVFERRMPLISSTLLYVLAMMVGLNIMVGVAALVLGTVCGIERRATGGVLAPVLTHLVWGLMMVLALPPIFGQ